ncbi:MAG: hypothetical protein HOF74_02060 [Gammaproteobacteria bacterium]|nr:hypothetical protein [Gammaproteobacteria bacterium]MBT3858594.1 hypothetical protein [Gammaproteobacteria bacterium]MBT3986668.1 hypothetical protein [Gammaproteobacteria bacterium]MBT4254980.1 hypothetical protein [Gammaproteobacteria bacterium]MBT4582764.1 hypothetical protein [Gammaproteobacteria bacterium]
MADSCQICGFRASQSTFLSAVAQAEAEHEQYHHASQFFHSYRASFHVSFHASGGIKSMAQDYSLGGHGNTG